MGCVITETRRAFTDFVARGLQEETKANKQREAEKNNGEMTKHRLCFWRLSGFWFEGILEAELRPFPGFYEIPLCSYLSFNELLLISNLVFITKLQFKCLSNKLSPSSRCPKVTFSLSPNLIIAFEIPIALYELYVLWAHQNLFVEVLTPRVSGCDCTGERIIKWVITLKWDH